AVLRRRLRMQELPALFLKGLKLLADARLVPAKRVPNSGSGFPAASFAPARAKGHWHTTQQDVRQSNGRFMRHCLHRLSDEVATVFADRLAQMRIKRGSVRN